MSTIGNSSGSLSVHTQISADIVTGTSENNRVSDTVARNNDSKGKVKERTNGEDRRSKNSQNRKLNGRQGGESQTAKVDREIAEKMLNGKGNGSSGVESQLQSQIQSKPGSLASMQLSKLSMHGGISGVSSGGSKENSMQAFEAYMVQMMMKEMRKTLPKGALGSNSMDMFMDMFDQAIAEQLAQRGGIGISESLERQFHSNQDSTTGDFNSQQGFSRSNQDGGEASSFGNTSQDLESKQVAMKLKKMGVSATHLEKFQNMYQTWKEGEQIDQKIVGQVDDVWQNFVASPSFQDANRNSVRTDSTLNPSVDQSREQLINKMIVDEISLGMMDPSLGSNDGIYDNKGEGFGENLRNDFGELLGIERVYGSDIGMLSQDPWKLQQILNQRNYEEQVVPDFKSDDNVNIDKGYLQNSSEDFEGGIESLYESENEGLPSALNGVLHKNHSSDISKDVSKHVSTGMSSDEMKNVFHSISIQAHDHHQKMSDVQPFLPLRGVHEHSEDKVYQFPVSGLVSSQFGMRHHPISHKLKHHDGMDIAAPRGSAIQPIADGQVISSGVNGGYGNVVVVEHDDGLTSTYAHCDELLVSVGDRVTKNMTIAKVGSTGASTGPHLHLEIRKGGELVDPVNYVGANFDSSIEEEAVPLSTKTNS
jgi:Rod binding domain-containing protein